jgi:hypothetical protein
VIFGDNYTETINEINKHENERFKRILAQTITHTVFSLIGIGMFVSGLLVFALLPLVLVGPVCIFQSNLGIALVFDEMYKYKDNSKDERLTKAEKKVFEDIRDAATEYIIPQALKAKLKEQGINISNKEAEKIIKITKQSRVKTQGDETKYINQWWLKHEYTKDIDTRSNDIQNQIQDKDLKIKFKDSRLVKEISKRVVKDTLKIKPASGLKK